MSDFRPFFINSNLILGNREFGSVRDLLQPAAGNTGNSYITYALVKTVLGGFSELRHIENVYDYDFSARAADVDYIKNACSHVFLILQDQIRLEESYSLKLPYAQIVRFLEECGKPVVIAGLGHNSFGDFDPQFHKKLDSSLVDFLARLSHMCPEIGIRGEFTAEILANLGIKNTRIIGCPSFFETGASRTVRKSESAADVRAVLTSPIAPKCLVGDPNVPYICQDFGESAQIDAMLFGGSFDKLADADLRRLWRKNIKIFTNPDKWRGYLKNFNFAMGTRVHGSIVSVNAGIPALCTSGDNRSREMCEFLKIPRFLDLPAASSRAALLEHILGRIDADAMNKSYPALFANYRDFIEKQGLPFLLDGRTVDASAIPNPTIPAPNLRAKMRLMTARIRNGAARTLAKIKRKIF